MQCRLCGFPLFMHTLLSPSDRAMRADYVAAASARHASAPELIAKSSASLHFRGLIDRIAPTNCHLLICGPTGAGKDVAARRIHERGLHHESPFIDVNCGAIPENLAESEFFGHAKGAFTGATHTRAGYFQQVGKGTLFLDEVGELPLSLQPKLLRVLETRRFRPIGSSDSFSFEGRIVAATHRDLQAMVKEGSFREDLFYRLAVFIVELPSLDQRREDIPELIAHFAAQQARPLHFSPEALRQLCQQSWPGNIRQLRNMIDQLGVLVDDPYIDLETLNHYFQPIVSRPATHEELADALLALPATDKLAAAEMLLIERALQKCEGNKSAAAKLLGVGRKSIERRLKSHESQKQEAATCLKKGQSLVDASQFSAAIPILKKCITPYTEGHPDAVPSPELFDAFRLLAISLRNVNGWLCSEAQACYEAALAIGRECGCDAHELSTLQFGIWTTQLMTLDLARARATAQDMLQHAQNTGHLAAQDEAHVAMANTLFWLGDSEEALACLQRGRLLDTQRQNDRVGAQGFDLICLAKTFEGLAAFQRGALTQAWAAMEMLCERASAGNPHAFDRAIALQGAAWLACLFEETERLDVLSEALESLSKAHGFNFYQGIGQVFRGCVLAARGDYHHADEAIREGYHQHMLRHGGKLFHSFQAWHRGEALLHAGEAKACSQVINQAIDIALEQQDRAYLGELMVIQARALWMLGELDTAEQELRSALSTAMALGSVPARIHAAHHLALFLLKERRRPVQATETLVRALRGATENGTYPVLVRAQALLAELQKDMY